MLEITDAEISAWVSSVLWPFFRIMAFFSIAPFFGARTVLVRLRVLFSFALALMVAPLIPEGPVVDSLSIGTLVITIQQVIIGFALGFITLLLFQVFILAGQATSMQMGLGFASMVDPSNGVSVAVLAQIYQTMVTLAFLAINGHLLLLDILVNSFYAMPVGSVGLGADKFQMLFLLGSWIFSAALSIALPAMISLLLVNIVFGILTRSAPQLNIFSLGFPVTMVLGVMIVWMTISGVLSRFNSFFVEHLEFLRTVVGA
jgi:flagellar biosynthesis protein FliR